MSLPRTTRSCGERAAAELPEHVTFDTYRVRLLKKFRSRRGEMQDGSPEPAAAILIRARKLHAHLIRLASTD